MKSRLEVTAALCGALISPPPSPSLSPVCVYAVWLWTRIAGYSLFSCCTSFFSVPRLRACWQPWLERLSSFLPFCSKILCEPQIFEGVSYLRRLFASIFHACHQLCFLQSLMRKKVGCSATRLRQSVSLTIKRFSNIRTATCASWRVVWQTRRRVVDNVEDRHVQ